ncbi:ABC transporter ATP-binding protein [Candidatus Nomurabacteria bacterium]|nr:ABC transporter ATP-binding protein [Candidatus Nomurabacteria bacterium]
MHAIAVKGLRKTYAPQKGQGEGTEALKGVSLTVEEGDFFALLGPNGAGKTTLIGITSSLVNKSDGEVKVFGVDIDKDRSLAKTHIGLVPQEFNFNIFEKVIDIVTTQAGYYGIPRAEALSRAEKLLKDLGLWEKKDMPSQTLSGGMKRRLMIARGLVHNPKLLILDEPTAGVDVEMRHGMWEFLKKLNAEGTTIILTTHYLEEAEALCRNIAIINKGTIVVNEPMQQLLESRGHAKLEQIYLDLIKQESPA